MTPKSTIESQNKMVFAVELGFTVYLSCWVPETFALLEGAGFLIVPRFLPGPKPVLYRRLFLLDAETRFADRPRAFLPPPAASAKP